MKSQSEIRFASKLLFRSSLLSLACVAGLSLVGGRLLVQTMKDDMGRVEVHRLAANVRQVFASHATEEVWRKPLSGRSAAVFETLARDLGESEKTVVLKVWDRAGKIVWSTEKRLIGTRSAGESLRKALAGEVVFEWEIPGHDDEVYRRFQGIPIFEAYVPVWREGKGRGKRADLVIETFTSAKPFFERMESERNRVWMMTVASGLAVFLVMLGTLRWSVWRLAREAARNQVLYQESAQIADRLKITEKIARAVGSSLVPEEVFRVIAAEIRKTVPYDRCVIAHVSPHTTEHVYWFIESDVEIPQRKIEDIPDLGPWFSKNVYETKKPVYIPDIPASGLDSLKILGDAGMRSTALIPILQDGECTAHLGLHSLSRDAFSKHQLDFLVDVAAIIGPAIRNATLFQESEKRRARLEIVEKISIAVGSSLRREDLFQAIAREIRQVIPCERVFIGSINFETEDIFYWYVESDVEVPPVKQDDVSRLEWYRNLYENNTPLIHGDLRKVSFRRAQDYAEAGLRSIMVVPIERDGRCFAHIALSSTRVDAFSGDDMELLVSLSSHINVALQNASLLQEAEIRATRLAALNDMGLKIAGNLELHEVFDRIVRAVEEILKTDYSRLFMVDENEQELVLRASHGRIPIPPGRVASIKIGESVTGWATKTGESLRIPDVLKDPHWEDLPWEWVPKKEIRALICQPLYHRGRIIGFINGMSRQVDFFTEEDSNILGVLASRAAAAIENARSLQRARREAEKLKVLDDLNRQISQSLEMNEVLQNITLSAVHLMSGNFSRLYLLDENSGLLHMKAQYGQLSSFPSTEGHSLASGSRGVVFQTGRPLLIPDVTKDDQFEEKLWAAEQNMCGYIAVPIFRDKDVIGVLNCMAKNTIRFSNDDVSLLQSLANLGSIAIQNARLFEDITTHAERLALSQARFQSIFDSAQDAVITIDEEGFVTLFNPAAEKMFGYASDEIIGRKINRLMPSPYTEAHDSYLFNFLTTGEKKAIGFVRTLDARRKNGEVFPIELSIGEVAVEKMRFFTGIVRDITERHEIDRMKNEFISVVSHEIRTPLTSLRGSLGLMEGGVAGDLSDQGKELLTIAVNNTERLIRLISDILDLEKIESGNMELHFASHPLEDLVDRAMEEMRGLAAENGIEIEKNTEECLVDVDSDSIIQVLVNLISNAVKFSDSGGSIVISSRCMEGEAEIRVEDTGRGIPRDALDGIFDRFKQVDSSDQREKGGTGLGLAICSAIVAQHGGRIWVESEPDEGSIFFFTLPRTELAPRRAAPPGETLKPSILVCEDDRDFVRLLQIFLEKEGYSVIPTFSAEEALAYLEENEVAAVVMDVNLPGMNGIDMLNVIKGYPETRRPPVIVLSVDEQVDIPDLPVPFLLDWIIKPLDEHRLRSRLKAAIKLGKAATALVVDDDPDLCEVVKRLLENRNIRVETAASGFEAVEKFRTTGPDILILDIVMPDGDGFYVMDTLRQELELRKVPIIIYSAEEPTSREKKRLATETTLFLTKLKTPQDEFIGHVVETLSGLLTDSPHPG